MKHIFIVNPTSGNGQYVDIIKQIKNYFKEEDNFEIVMTEYPGHAKEIAALYGEGHRLYSVGGDGTAHEVLNGLQDNVAMGMIPAGSGNDFLRNIQPKASLDGLIGRMVNGSIEAIDYVKFNDFKQLNCTNVGFDADVNKGVNESKMTLIPRKFLYALFAIKGLIRKKTVDITITKDGKSRNYKVLLATFMNGQYYGGGFMSAPNANLQDGLFDVTLIANVSRLRILRLLPIYFKGNHLGFDVVTNYQATSIEVHSPQLIQVGCDGELTQRNSFRLDIVPKGLRLIIPKGSSLKGNQI